MPAHPTQTLRRLLGVLVIVIATLFATTAQASIGITITAPSSGGLAGNTLTVTATVTSSPYALASVTAKVGTASGSMTSTGSTTYSGTVDLSSIASGANTLVVTATDLGGGTASTSIPISVDRPPTVTVTAPVYHTVATPSIRLTASCADDLGCAQLVATDGLGRVITTGTTSIDGVFTLTAEPHTGIIYQAKDSAGQTTKTTGVEVFIMPADISLVEIDRVPGDILDVDATRTLYVTLDGRLVVRTRSTGAESVVATGIAKSSSGFPDFNSFRAAYVDGAMARLTPVGVAFRSDPGMSAEWYGGSLTTLTSTGYWLALSRNYGAWYYPSHGFYLRDLVAHTDALLAAETYPPTTPLPRAPEDVSLTDAGDVAWHAYISATGSTPYGLARYHAGTTSIVATTTTSYWYETPRTDGINILTVDDRCGFPSGDLLRWFDSAGTAHVIVPSCGYPGPDPYPPIKMAAVGGWMAWHERSGTTSTSEVFRRSPAGVSEQVGIFTGASQLDALGDDGSMMFFGGDTAASIGFGTWWGTRYYSAPGKLPVSVSPGLGRSLRVGGVWYVTLGPELYVYDPCGGTGDAGTDGGACTDAAPFDAGAGDTTAADTTVADTTDASVTDTAVADTSLDASPDATVDASPDTVDSSAGDSAVADAGLDGSVDVADATPDGGAIDASPDGSASDTPHPADTGSTVDSSARSDTGDDAGADGGTDSGGGCAWAPTTAGHGERIAWVVLALVGVAARRRRRTSPTTHSG